VEAEKAFEEVTWTGRHGEDAKFGKKELLKRISGEKMNF